MTKFAFNLFGLVFLALFATDANATTLGYDLTFKDESGTIVGDGSVRYDPSITEDLYEYMGFRCPTPPAPICNYVDTWTPLESFAAVIGGYDIFELGSDTTDFWVEGTYNPPGKPSDEGRFEERWLVGDLFFAESQFSTRTTPPPLGVDFFQTDFSFSRSIGDGTYYEVSGKVDMQAIPAPPALASLGLGLLLLAGWRRLASR